MTDEEYYNDTKKLVILSLSKDGHLAGDVRKTVSPPPPSVIPGRKANPELLPERC